MKQVNNKNNTVSSVWNLVEPIANNLGYKIWDIKFIKEGPNYYLRVFIDNDSGITIDDCEKVSKAIDKPLDDLDPIEQNYCLEVCSPGIERELTRDEHFQNFINHNINIRLIRPLENNNKRQISGKLVSFDKDNINISIIYNNDLFIPRKNIAFVKLGD